MEYFESLVATENKGHWDGWLAAREPENLQFYTQTSEEIRDNELLRKKQVSLSNREISVLGEIISSLYPGDVSEVPSISNWADE